MDDKEKFMVINEVGIGIYGGDTAFEADNNLEEKEEDKK